MDPWPAHVSRSRIGVFRLEPSELTAVLSSQPAVFDATPTARGVAEFYSRLTSRCIEVHKRPVAVTPRSFTGVYCDAVFDSRAETGTAEPSPEECVRLATALAGAVFGEMVVDHIDSQGGWSAVVVRQSNIRWCARVARSDVKRAKQLLKERACTGGQEFYDRHKAEIDEACRPK